MSLEKKSSNACQKMDNGKANYLGLDLSTINQMSKGKILGAPAFPCWVQSQGEAALQPKLKHTAHTIYGDELLISGSAELTDHLRGS